MCVSLKNTDINTHSNKSLQLCMLAWGSRASINGIRENNQVY